jgi:hypothetical protein
MNTDETGLFISLHEVPLGYEPIIFFRLRDMEEAIAIYHVERESDGSAVLARDGGQLSVWVLRNPRWNQ